MTVVLVEIGRGGCFFAVFQFVCSFFQKNKQNKNCNRKKNGKNWNISKKRQEKKTAKIIHDKKYTALKKTANENGRKFSSKRNNFKTNTKERNITMVYKISVMETLAAHARQQRKHRKYQ